MARITSRIVPWAIRSIRDVLLDNENYTQCPLFLRLRQDIRHYMETVVWAD